MSIQKRAEDNYQAYRESMWAIAELSLYFSKKLNKDLDFVAKHIIECVSNNITIEEAVDKIKNDEELFDEVDNEMVEIIKKAIRDLEE